MEEPSLAIHTQLPEDEERERQEEANAANGVDGGGGSETDLGEMGAVMEGDLGSDGAPEAWALVTEEVGLQFFAGLGLEPRICAFITAATVKTEAV